jgi:hypothetical protein
MRKYLKNETQYSILYKRKIHIINTDLGIVVDKKNVQK